MITRSPIAQLTPKDLAVMQEASARHEAVELNPDAYSANETEQIVLRYYRVMGELAARYELVDDYHINKWTGQVWEDED